ncbi:MAG TPA: hypothetical protein V6C95_00600 [Coleofasciculaceae cyanobacterium]
MASEHPKITSYIPTDILKALDKWRAEQKLDSRNAAVVAILADYLGVQYPIQLPDTAPLNIQLRTVLDGLAQICQRMDALEEAMSTAQKAVQRTAPETAPLSRSTASKEVQRAVPLEGAISKGKAQNKAPSTVPPAPLTQMALAKRLGCSDKAIEKQRKQGDKESFAAWSKERDPDNKAWTWEGGGGRGQPLRFMPVT